MDFVNGAPGRDVGNEVTTDLIVNPVGFFEYLKRWHAFFVNSRIFEVFAEGL